MSMYTKRIALGFSCQSTSTNEMISAETIRSPFDHNVTTKDFLLNSLRSDANPFASSDLDLRLYKQPVSGIEGIRSGGIFFWHDFERDGNALAEDWPANVASLLERYERRWLRFVELCRRGDIKKQFVITNTQSNLGEFCEADFQSLFGIDGKFLRDLIERLNEFGVRNYAIDLTVRDIEDFLSVLPIVAENKDSCHARFCGPMHLPPHSLIVHETGLDMLGISTQFGGISEICGQYIGGLRLEKISDRAAIIYGPTKAEGEARVFPGGYILALSGGFDYFLRATFNDGLLSLSNKHVWTKLK